MRFMTGAALVAALGAMAPAAAYAQQPPPAAPAASEAQTPAEAVSARAFEAYQKGDYPSALSLYQAAIQLTPAAAIYFNVANIYDKKLPDPRLAIDFYRRCVAAPDVTPELSLKATARIQALSQELAQKQAAAPPPAPPKTEEPRPPDDPGRSLRVGGLVVGGIGIATLAVGLGVGLDAKLKLDSARQVCTGKNCTTQAGVDDMRAAGTLATVSTAGCVVGGAALAVGIALFAFAPRKAKAAAPAASASRGSPVTVRVVPVLGPAQTGVSLSGAFF